MSRIGVSFKNFRDRMRSNINIKPKNFIFFLALLLIVILTFVIRISPILRGGQLIKAFDPWMQYYNVEYLNTHTLYEYFHWHDYKSWFPNGIDRFNLKCHHLGFIIFSYTPSSIIIPYSNFFDLIILSHLYFLVAIHKKRHC